MFNGTSPTNPLFTCRTWPLGSCNHLVQVPLSFVKNNLDFVKQDADTIQVSNGICILFNKTAIQFSKAFHTSLSLYRTSWNFCIKNISDKIILNKRLLRIFFTFQKLMNEAKLLVTIFSKRKVLLKKKLFRKFLEILYINTFQGKQGSSNKATLLVHRYLLIVYSRMR